MPSAFSTNLSASGRSNVRSHPASSRGVVPKISCSHPSAPVGSRVVSAALRSALLARSFAGRFDRSGHRAPFVSLTAPSGPITAVNLCPIFAAYRSSPGHTSRSFAESHSASAPVSAHVVAILSATTSNSSRAAPSSPVASTVACSVISSTCGALQNTSLPSFTRVCVKP